MNAGRLRQAESEFLARYPGGFDHPDMVAVGKKHKVPQMIEMTQLAFQEGNFGLPTVIVASLTKVIGRSSLVSVFEKSKFKHFANTLTPMEHEWLVDGLQEQLYGHQQSGFEMVVDLLGTRKLAKWPLISVCPMYFRPDHEVFVKPTTIKTMIDALELHELQYHPAPTWAFYAALRSRINEMKSMVDDSLSPNNAAFTGFLMMTLGSVKGR